MIAADPADPNVERAMRATPTISRSRDAMVADVRRRLGDHFRVLADGSRFRDLRGADVQEVIAQCDRLADELVIGARTSRAHADPDAQALTAADARDAGPVPRLLLAFTVQV
jgi:hypothetical protein